EGNYHLQAGSPCINTGDPTFPLEADGTIIDMGALSTGDGDPPGEGTEVSGEVGGQTWTKEGNPYTVVGYLYVSEGTTLTIEPGVEVQFDGWGMCVDGILHAVGTPEEKIILDCGMIHIHGITTGGSIIQHATIQNAAYGAPLVIQGMSSPPFRLSHSIIHNNEEALSVSGNAEIYNNTITQNVAGAIHVAQSVVIKNNIITENGEYGIKYWDNWAEVPTLSHNNVWGHINDYVNISSDPTDISVDPLFVDDDYHLQEFYSPCIDKGHPDDDFSQEPYYNGNRINMGAYGNTPEAARTRRPRCPPWPSSRRSR
ncbi:right-handed parallel beta-helix repeat-containing protein, partial [Candidatus Omnitrophota bacterium]